MTYIESILHKDNGLEEDTKYRYNCVWIKWRKVSGILCKKGSLFKSKFYKTVVRPDTNDVSECWVVDIKLD